MPGRPDPLLAEIADYVLDFDVATSAEAIQTALPIRRCSGTPGTRSAPCAAAQLGEGAGRSGPSR